MKHVVQFGVCTRKVGYQEMKLPGNGPQLWLCIRITWQLSKNTDVQAPLPNQMIPGYLRAAAGTGI